MKSYQSTMYLVLSSIVVILRPKSGLWDRCANREHTKGLTDHSVCHRCPLRGHMI